MFFSGVWKLSGSAWKKQLKVKPSKSELLYMIAGFSIASELFLDVPWVFVLVGFMVQFKVLVLTFQALYGLLPSAMQSAPAITGSIT